MQMKLEDEYEDIISKASKGLNKKVSGDNVARDLNLNAKALENIGNYKPKEFDYSKIYDGLKIKKISSPFMGGEVNAYIVIDEEKNCVIIDTAQVANKIVDFVKENNLKVVSCLKTHEHFDHVEGMDTIKKEFGVSENLEFGKRKIEVIETPGHSEESLTFKIDKFLFVGDLIFAGSLGGGMYSYEKLLESANKVLEFENCYIFPGHGPSTTVKEEKENNAFIH